MSRVGLTGGAYQARSVIAAAQRSVNLYAEPMPEAEGEPARMAHYPTPGMTLQGTVGSGPIRGLIQASNGTAYCVSGSGVYSFFPANHLGDITPGLRSPVSMKDNGLDLLIVDGTSSAWVINLASNTMSALDAAALSAYRYWRLNMASSGHTDALNHDGGFVGFAEVQFRVGGVDQMGAGTATATGPQFQTYEPRLAADGNTATWWVVNTHNAIWTYDFVNTTKRIDSVAIWARGDESPEMAPKDFTVECSNDGSNWSVAGSYTGQTWTLGEVKTFSFSTPMSDFVFPGATRVDYLDTYFVLNKPGTPQFYLSDSLALTFDPLWFANKEAANDYLVVPVVAKREVWLLGERTTEVWFNSGGSGTIANSFPLEIVPNVLIPHGCIAKFSPVEIDNAVYWLSRTKNGQGIVLAGAGYEGKRVSTYAIEAALTSYVRIDDAIGWTYQLGGHQYYVLSFPTQDTTWCYDVTTGLWHEWLWIDSNGTEHRHRGNCAYNVNGVVMVGDWQSGNIYGLDASVGTDAGNPIKRVRSFPHLVNDGKRQFWRQFLADMETGTGGYDPRAGFPPIREGPQVSLRWSDDRGHTWGSPVLNDLGGSGAYLNSLQWQRLGLARDRVFELSWSTPYQTSLQGAWVDAIPAQS